MTDAAEAPAERTCPSCHTKNPVTHHICSKCSHVFPRTGGAHLAKAAAPATVSATDGAAKETPSRARIARPPKRVMTSGANPIVAVCLALFCVPGLGHFYGGFVLRGLIFLALEVPLAFLFTARTAFDIRPEVAGIAALVFLPLRIFELVDAYRCAGRERVLEGPHRP